MHIAAAAAGIINNPDCHAGNPRPSWNSSGSRNGNPPMPRRVMKPPATDTRNVRLRNSDRSRRGKRT